MSDVSVILHSSLLLAVEGKLARHAIRCFGHSHNAIEYPSDSFTYISRQMHATPSLKYAEERPLVGQQFFLSVISGSLVVALKCRAFASELRLVNVINIKKCVFHPDDVSLVNHKGKSEISKKNPGEMKFGRCANAKRQNKSE